MEEISAVAQLEFSAVRNRTRFAPEFCLLLAAAGSPEFNVEEILAQPINWEVVLHLAEQHRLLPSLHAFLGTSQTIPASIRSAIKARYDRHALNALRFSAELARVARHLAECGIPVLAHKGPALSHLLHRDSASRQFFDLDFLVRERDVEAACGALQDLGYSPPLDLSSRKRRAYLRSGYEFSFGLSESRNLIELQWRILPRFYSIDFDMDELLHRSGEFEFAGFPLRTLANEDLALVLCVHAAKHQWSQLAMLRDIASLTQLDLNWRWTADEADRLGIRRILEISFLLARDLLGRDPPIAILWEQSRILAESVKSRLTDEIEPNPESLDYFRFMMRIRERRRDRMRLGWRLAITPSLSEWEMVALPDSLFFLYRSVRLFRLARRFLSA